MVTDASARVWSDLVVPPGELLQEELNEIGMTQQELAARSGRPAQVINEIIQNKKRITHETALEFEKVLGIPAHFWVNLEADYQLSLARLRDQEELQRQEEWLNEFPVREMERREWIPRYEHKIDKVRALLRFLGVASFSAWRQAALGLRVTPIANVSEYALAVWLRKGELDGRESETESYDRGRFEEALSSIRSLTTEPPKEFVLRLKELCAYAGVAVVFTQELPRSGAHGSARWIARDKALIQLSLRYKTNDHLWFSFFHEACHVLRHQVHQVHVDGIGNDDGREEEANEFAADALIPLAEWKSFVRSGNRSLQAIRKFAQEVGIAQGIVVGRLQHEELIPWQSNLNRLKVRFQWVEAAED